MRYLLPVLASACMSVSTSSINAPPHPMFRRPAGVVEVYSSGAPSRPHVDVAILHAASPYLHDLDTFVSAVRTTAGDLGCDAIVIGNAGGGYGGLKSLLATCIVYSDQAAGVAAKPFDPADDPGSGD